MSDWYYAADNEQKGPINESELKANIAANKVPADALVWKDGMDNWTPANQVAAFTFRQPPTPAAIQPGAAPIPSTKADPSVNNPDSAKPLSMGDIVGTPTALEVDPEDADKNKIFGILAYLGILVLVPILAAKDSPFAKYHANQGLVLFLAWIALCVILNILNVIIIGMLHFLAFLTLILSLVYIIPLGLTILGIINAASGKCVPLPVIGGVKLLK